MVMWYVLVRWIPINIKNFKKWKDTLAYTKNPTYVLYNMYMLSRWIGQNQISHKYWMI